jgi:hypothetical protein
MLEARGSRVHLNASVFIFLRLRGVFDRCAGHISMNNSAQQAVLPAFFYPSVSGIFHWDCGGWTVRKKIQKIMKKIRVMTCHFLFASVLICAGRNTRAAENN